MPADNVQVVVFRGARKNEAAHVRWPAVDIYRDAARSGRGVLPEDQRPALVELAPAGTRALGRAGVGAPLSPRALPLGASRAFDAQGSSAPAVD